MVEKRPNAKVITAIKYLMKLGKFITILGLTKEERDQAMNYLSSLIYSKKR
jgi:hypothetical protein